MIIHLHPTIVRIGEHETTTYMAGYKVVALHAEQPGQAETAQRIGAPSVREMNRTHDLVHSLVARALGLDYSPTLLAVAKGEVYPYWEAEEAAVLAVQAWAFAADIDLTDRDCKPPQHRV